MTDRTRLLLIDDDSVDRASVRRALISSGIPHDLAESADGAGGLRLAKSQTFDCVLLDFHLPDADAFQLLAELVSPEGGGQAVVMLTGEDDQSVAFRLMRAGALDYLAKDEATPSTLARAIRYAKARRAFLTELENARIDAEEKSRALDQLNRQKTLLLSIIAHDLRNPFQALLGLSTMLTQAIGQNNLTQIERRAQGIKDAAAQAYALMESLLGWASLQMDAIAVTLVDVDIGEIVRQTMEGAADAAERKGVHMKSEGPDLAARAHPDMLAAVLRNLVSNAIKFSNLGGEIVISWRRSGGDAIIEVADEGIGMEPARVANLFNVESRTTMPGTAGERGGGLGLLLCRDLVDRQGGALDVRSAPGAGAVFSVRIPAAEP